MCSCTMVLTQKFYSTFGFPPVFWGGVGAFCCCCFVFGWCWLVFEGVGGHGVSEDQKHYVLYYVLKLTNSQG